MNKAVKLSVSIFTSIFLTAFSFVSVFALKQPTVTNTSTSVLYNDFDVEYYPTGFDSDNYSTLSITSSGSPTFEVTDLQINGNTTAFNGNGQGSVILDSDLTIYNNQFNVVGDIDLSTVRFTALSNDSYSTGSITSTYRYSYQKVQHITIRLDAPAYGLIRIPFTRSEEGYSVYGLNNVIAYGSVYNGVPMIVVLVTGDSVINLELSKIYTHVTTISTNAFISFNRADFITDLQPYETPVSDESTHSLLNELVNGNVSNEVKDLNNGKSELDNTSSNLLSLSDNLHDTETQTLTLMNESLNNDSLSPDRLNQMMNITEFSFAQEFVRDRMNFFLDSKHSALLIIFVVPLILGIALKIIGRLR